MTMQVASFPGADFDKVPAGLPGPHASGITDHTRRLLASSGTEMAEAVQEWLVQDWLDGNEQSGTHTYARVRAFRMTT